MYRKKDKEQGEGKETREKGLEELAQCHVQIPNYEHLVFGTSLLLHCSDARE